MSKTLIKSLSDKRAELWEKAKTHLDTVERSGDGLTGEAETTWAAMNKELSEYDARIKELVEVEHRNDEAEKVRAEFSGLRPAGHAGDGTSDEGRSDADILRAIGNGEMRGHTFEAGERRDLTAGTATDGKELVPTSFRAQLYEHLVATSAIRRAGATVLTTESGEPLQIPKTTSYSAAAIVAEAGSIGESDPQFGQVTLGAFKYAFIVDASSELLTDSAIDLVPFLARQGGRALGLGSSAHFVDGDGSDKPQGIVGASTTGKTGATSVAGAFTADDLIDLYYSVIEPYRVNAAWLMRDATLAAARKLKGSDNNYLWQPGLQAGEPSTLLGRPAYSDPNVPAVATSAKSVIFGDPSAYFIRDVSGVRVERSDHARWDNDLVSFRFILRTDGDLVDTTGAVKAFAGGAS